MRHELTLETERYAGSTGHFGGRGIIFLIEGTQNRAGYGIGGWDRTGSGRTEMHGPMVTGPHGYLYGLAGVIDNHGGTGAINRDAEKNGLLFRAKAGDKVIINGIAFELKVDARGCPKLVAE